MFSMLPQPCHEFEDKADVEMLLSRIVSQLSDSLGMPFLLAAKELMDCCGFPERVIIKCLDPSVYAIMFPATPQPVNSPVSFSPGVHVADVASAAAALAQCAVCFDCDTNITLIQMPCNHRLCEQCFSLCFLSDSEHPFGNLPDEQTPVSDAEETPRCQNFFSCPTCKLPLPEEFWKKFPDYLVGAQRDRAVDSRVSLEKVHCRIVTNALRRLRHDPSSTIARCGSSGVMKGRYVVALTVTQSVTCMGCTFDSVVDLRNFTGSESLPPCGLSPMQLSQWQRATRAAQEAGKPMHPQVFSSFTPGWPAPMNAPRSLERTAHAGTEAGASDLVPTFISERDRPKTEQGRLLDFRMCPKCFGGYYINMHCSELGMHQGEEKSGSHVQNVCRECGFFSREWSEWPRADELLKANKFKAQLPHLHGTMAAITAIQSCLSRYFSSKDAPHTAQLLHQPALQVSYGSCLGRRFIR
jgi:hypothetical protein